MSAVYWVMDIEHDTSKKLIDDNAFRIVLTLSNKPQQRIAVMYTTLGNVLKLISELPIVHVDSIRIHPATQQELKQHVKSTNETVYIRAINNYCKVFGNL